MDVLDALNYKEQYNSSTTYQVGDIANDSGVDYVSLLPNNANNTPHSSPLFWGSLSAPNPGGIGPVGPQEVLAVNGPVTLSSGGVTLISVSVPQGLYKIRATVGNITISLSGTGSVSTIFPLFLVNSSLGIYEGLFYFGSSSGISLTSNQSPGTSPSTIVSAFPVVTP